MGPGTSDEVVFPKKTFLKRNISGGIAASLILAVLFAFLTAGQYRISPADAINAALLLGFFLLFFLVTCFLHFVLSSSYVFDKSKKSFIHRLYFLGINCSLSLGTCDQVVEVNAKEEPGGKSTSGKSRTCTVLVTFFDGSKIEVEDFPGDQISRARESAKSLRAIISPENSQRLAKASTGFKKNEERGKQWRDRLVLISIGGFCAFFGGILAWALIQDVLLVSIASMKWVKTPCTILSSEVAERVTFNKTNKLLVYDPKISYSYKIQGKTFISDRVAVFLPSFPDQGSCRLMVDRYPERSIQTCYVDVENPQTAVLDRSLNPNIAWAIIPFASFLFGILLTIAGLMG